MYRLSSIHFWLIDNPKFTNILASKNKYVRHLFCVISYAWIEVYYRADFYQLIRIILLIR